jgi:opacity protein-like surface antigen
MRNTAWMLAGALALVSSAAIAADVDDPTAPSDQVHWARWQGRLSLGAPSSAWRAGADETAAPKWTSASVMGDYYFGRSLAGIGQPGGFRASSGLITGPRGVLSTGQPGLTAGGSFSTGSRLLGQTAASYGAEASSDNATLPYLGLGYTGLSVRSGWSFSADLGLVAQSPGNAVRLGRVFGGGQSLDDLVRDLRLAPLLQVGVSYAF